MGTGLTSNIYSISQQFLSGVVEIDSPDLVVSIRNVGIYKCCKFTKSFNFIYLSPKTRLLHILKIINIFC